MNVTGMALSTNSTVTQGTKVLTTLSPEASTTVYQVLTTALPPSTHSTIIAVVIVVILLTIAVLGFVLYFYLCHNKGQYRTTGELAPGQDPDEEYQNQTATEKKEYFI